MKNKETITVEELVKSVLNGKNVDVYDRERIKHVLNNASNGYGAINFDTNEVIVTYTYGKNGIVRYHINYNLITDSQLDRLQKRANVKVD